MRVATLLLVLALTVPAMAQEGSDKQPDMKAQIEQAVTVTKAAIAKLELVGSWSIDETYLKSPMNPKGESKNKASATSRLILGGTHLRTEHRGSMQGIPYQASGTWSYDAKSKKYVMDWVDNWGWRGAYKGGFDADGVLLLKGTEQHHGMDSELKWTFHEDGSHTFEYTWIKEGQRMPTLRSKATRRKGVAIGVKLVPAGK